MQIIKDLAKRVLYYAGFYHIKRTMAAIHEPRLLIVMYHDVVSDDDHSQLEQSKPTQSQFAAQIATLKQYYRVLSMEAAIKEMHDLGQLKEPTAAITFDDGYESVYKYAFPVLRKYDVSATVFLLTGWINEEIEPWWVKLKLVLNDITLSKEFVSMAVSYVKQDVVTEMIKDPENFRGTFRTSLESVLRTKPDQEARSIVGAFEQFVRPSSKPDLQLFRPLSWEQIREMSDAGICFGAHTCTHPNFRHLDPVIAESEIVDSRREIEEKLGKPVEGFAFPYGQDLEAYERLVSILSSHGFSYSCSAIPGVNDSKSNFYLLRRIALPITLSRALVARELILGYRDE